MGFYRKHWHDIGGLIALVLGGGLALFGKRLSRPQLFLALNFIALLVHQFEEYRFPGFFPGHFNGGVSKSEKPDRYPLNTQSAVMVNIAFGYPFYLLPILLPRQAWLGLLTVLVGFSQVGSHGIVFPRRTGKPYSPGILTALFLHLPIGIAFIRAMQHAHRLKRADWIKAIMTLPLVAVVGIQGLIKLFEDKESPYRFTPQQVGPYGRDER